VRRKQRDYSDDPIFQELFPGDICATDAVDEFDEAEFDGAGEVNIFALTWD